MAWMATVIRRNGEVELDLQMAGQQRHGGAAQPVNRSQPHIHLEVPTNERRVGQQAAANSKQFNQTENGHQAGVLKQTHRLIREGWQSDAQSLGQHHQSQALER